MVFFLIGFMGCGKSYWGKVWSNTYQYTFVDLDEAIEKEAGTTIATIFETKGENYFRNLESAILTKLLLKQNTIVACGGGTPCYNENMEWMKKNGCTVYLKASPQFLSNRLLFEKHQRPLLKEIPDEKLVPFIEQKLRLREPFFNQAHNIVDAESITAATLLQLTTTNCTQQYE